jgi:predicted nucleic acid-binding protein
LKRVLKDKFALPGSLINDYVRLIQQDSTAFEPGDPPVTRLKDKDDLGILSAGIGGKVDVLVTGDKELHRVGRVAAVRIMSPREFWQELVESG